MASSTGDRVRRRQRRRRTGIPGLHVCLLGLCAMAGCAHPTARYVNPSSDLGAVRTVAVIPFENLTGDKLASERVEKIFTTELLSLGAFEIVEPGEVLRALREAGAESAALTPDDVKKLGKSLHAQALFLGVVVEYDEGRGGVTPAPQVTLQLRLLDTETAKTVWSVSRTSSGATVTARLFGLGGKSASIVAQEIINEELSRLGR